MPKGYQMGRHAFVVGEDTHGRDFKVYGATSGKYMLWDASADTFTIMGTQTSTATVSTAALGTVRAVYGKVIGSAASITEGNIVGVRGEASIPSGKTIAGGAYLYGVQGKLTFAGTMNHADSRLCAVLAQLDISSGTYTAGQISALWVDAGATGVAGSLGGQFNLVRITNTTASVPNSVVYVYAEASYLFDLAGGPGGNADWYAANTHTIDGHALSYIIKVKDPAGNTGYIPVLAAVPE